MKIMFGELIDEKGNQSKLSSHNNNIIDYAISAVRDCNTFEYENLRKLIFLPSRRYIQQLTNDYFSPEVASGVDRTMAAFMAEQLQNRGKKLKSRQPVTTSFVKYDSMRHKGGVLLNNIKSTRNRLRGCVVSDNLSVAKTKFERYVYELTKENQNGKEQNTTLLQSTSVLQERRNTQCTMPTRPTGNIQVL
jgi:hypothetical protein